MHKLLALLFMVVFALTLTAHNIDEADSIQVKSAEVSTDSDDALKEHFLLTKFLSTAKKITSAKKSRKTVVAEKEIALVIAEDTVDDLANVPEIELVIDKNEITEESQPLVLTFDPIEYYPNGQNPVCEECANKSAVETANTEYTAVADETDEASQPAVLYLDPIEYSPNGENPVCEECANKFATEEIQVLALAVDEEASRPTVYSYEPIEYNHGGVNPVCEQCAEHFAENC
jgi:hypothetical protein